MSLQYDPSTDASPRVQATPPTKEIIAEARRVVRPFNPRPRVLATSYLGFCPKREIAVGYAGGREAARVAAVRFQHQVASRLAALGSTGPRLPS